MEGLEDHGERGMTFERPYLLLLLLLVPVFHWLRVTWISGEEKRLKRLVRPVLWGRVGIEPPPRRTLTRWLWSAGLLMAFFSLSGPTWGRGEAFIPAGGRNVAIALDVSRSMASDDEVPSRLGRASAEIQRLVRAMPGTRFSLILFSGQARLAVPITLDSDYLFSRLPMGWEEPTYLAPGTNLGDLVAVMGDALPGPGLESRVGVIFSDGGFHDYGVERSVEEARRRNMALVTVGLGGDSPVTIPDHRGGVLLFQGDTVRTVLEEESLIRLAQGTGGFYTRVSEAGDLTGALNRLLESTSMEARLQAANTGPGRRYQLFLGAALLLICSALILEGRGL